MDAPAHTFSLPEAETHKLESVTEELRRQPLPKKLHDFVRANAWPSVWAAFGLGVIVGVAIKTMR